MLFNEPKLLKFDLEACLFVYTRGFSALQRAEIAEIRRMPDRARRSPHVSVLFNEPKLLKSRAFHYTLIAPEMRFSALQRAEIAEMRRRCLVASLSARVSVLFNEPKLLKWRSNVRR